MERIAVDTLRLTERFAPPALLAWLLWPAAAVWSAWELAYHRPTLSLFRRLPPDLRPAWRAFLWPVRVWRHRCRLNLTKLLSAWPDRLRERRWQERGRLVGFEQLEKLRGEGRPVVLAVPHFGPVSALYHWLRARGLPVAALVGRDLRTPLTYR